MASKIRINTGALNQTRQNVQNQLNQIKKEIEQISADMNELNGMWKGDAHETFQAAIQSDLQLLQDACESLRGVVQYESNAVTEYNKCEQQVNEMIAQIHV